ncbi:MAG: hypothetical protein ACRDHY_02385, partial [Anaerolineales bacterium]
GEVPAGILIPLACGLDQRPGGLGIQLGSVVRGYFAYHAVPHQHPRAYRIQKYGMLTIITPEEAPIEHAESEEAV